MNIKKTTLQDVYIIETRLLDDNRGKFVKIFNFDSFNKFGLRTDFLESYYSISKKNVIRGMHFQIPPSEHEKIVYVPNGRIMDVVLDIRRNSETFGKYINIELSNKNGYCIYIPTGCAHGFISLENNTVVTYMQTSTYNSRCDKGIKYNSFGFNWNCENPILSARDRNFPTLEEFISPF